MNSDLDVHSIDDDERGPSVCSWREKFALLHSYGPNKARGARPHAPWSEPPIYLVRRKHRTENMSGHELLVRINRRRRSLAYLRLDFESRRANRTAAAPRSLPAFVAHDCCVGYLIGTQESVKRSGACVSETLLDLDRSGKGPADPTRRAIQLPFRCSPTIGKRTRFSRHRRRLVALRSVTHHLLASIRIQPSSLQEPIASDLAVHQIIRTNP